MNNVKKINVPVTESLNSLKLGDLIEISGIIFTGRDAVLPKLVSMIDSGEIKSSGINLEGSVIFHTAVSPAGVGPTSSNKIEIESSIPALSRAGVKLHLGKGAISRKTVEALDKYGSAFAVMPPVTALLESQTLERTVIAFENEGMEAMHMLKVQGFPAVIAAIHGKSLYDMV